MSTTKHTPGPWALYPYPTRPYFTQVHVNGAAIADVYASGLLKPEETTANARLIAAAPDLLAALKVLMHPDGLSLRNMPLNVNQARAAIQKAEGTT